MGVGGVAGSNENKANSAQFDLKLGLGLSLAILTFTLEETFWVGLNPSKLRTVS